MESSFTFSESESVEVPQKPASGLRELRGLRASSNDSAGRGSQDLDLGLLLMRQHREVMQTLDSQDRALQALLKYNARGAFSPNSALSLRTPPAEKEISKVATIQPKILPEAAPEPTRTSFTPKFFKTYSQEESRLREVAKKRPHTQPTSTRENILHSRETAMGRLVKHPSFDIFFGVVVILNCLFLGFEVQMTLNHPGQTLLYIKVAEWIFTALFTAELVLRLIAAGPRLFWSEDWMWAFLDLIIVLFSLWEVVVQLVCGIDGGSCNLQGVSGVTSLKTMRIIRITRLVKTVRLAKVFRFVMAFRMLITSIMHTLKSLFWALALLILIVYIFAVLFTQAVNDYLSDSGPMSQRELDNSQRYYGSMMQTMLSLFMSITSGVSWEEVLAPLQAISMAWVFIFLFYISFAYFAVLNVVTGVFCQSAIDGAQNDHATKVHSILAHKEAHLEQIRRLFSKLDAEDSGIITYDMFQERINSPAVRNFFATLGLDIWDAWSFFKCLDLDAGGAVEIEEFLMGCLRLRGQATAIDVGKIISNQTWQLRNQGHFQAYIEVKLQELTSQMATLTGVNGLSDEQMEMMFAKHGDESPEDSVINLSRMSEGEDPFEDG